MDEQMIADIAKAIGWATGDRNAYAAACAAATAAHSVIAGKVAELSYHAEQLSTYLAQPTISEKNLASARWHNDKLRAALAPYPERRHE